MKDISFLCANHCGVCTSSYVSKSLCPLHDTRINASRRSAYDQLRLQPRPTAVSSKPGRAARSRKAPAPQSRKRAAASRWVGGGQEGQC